MCYLSNRAVVGVAKRVAENMLANLLNITSQDLVSIM